jgi:hypothetical protein
MQAQGALARHNKSGHQQNRLFFKKNLVIRNTAMLLSRKQKENLAIRLTNEGKETGNSNTHILKSIDDCQQ